MQRVGLYSRAYLCQVMAGLAVHVTSVRSLALPRSSGLRERNHPGQHVGHGAPQLQHDVGVERHLPCAQARAQPRLYGRGELAVHLVPARWKGHKGCRGWRGHMTTSEVGARKREQDTWFQKGGGHGKGASPLWRTQGGKA